MTEELLHYVPILIQVGLALGLALTILAVSHVFGQRAKTSKIKDTAYECGLLPEGPNHTRFSVKFYVVAMLFILFDVEIVFLLPWALIFREFVAYGIPIMGAGLFFIMVLVIGLFYETKKGALEWEK